MNHGCLRWRHLTSSLQIFGDELSSLIQSAQATPPGLSLLGLLENLKGFLVDRLLGLGRALILESFWSTTRIVTDYVNGRPS